MYMTYDGEVDASYIGLIDNIKSADIVTEIHHPNGINPWEINLDFDDRGRFVGLEMLFSGEGLPPEFLAMCERIA